MNSMLERENKGLLSNSVTVEQFLKSMKRIDGQNIRQLESELALQVDTKLIARSVITRKLGDECSSMQTTSWSESANSATPEVRGNNRERNLLGLMQEESEWSRGGNYDAQYSFSL